MFFPIRTDRRLKRTPWVNYTLVALNALIFLATYAQITDLNLFVRQSVGIPREMLIERYPVFQFYLTPQWMEWYQFLTYQFLHNDWWHLLGNMLFLFVFGNSVEDRLGRVGYLFFYLTAGVMAGIGHVAVETSPVLGASGAVAGVTGAYLALFPLSNVTIVYWFFFIGAFEVASMYLILFQIGWNVLAQLMGVGNVAYLAHLAGYAFGFSIGMGLLLTRLLPREPYDMLSLLEQRRRRAQFRAMTRRGYQPWEHAGPPGAPIGEAPPVSAQEQQIMDRRSRINTALGEHRVGDAAALYRALLADAPGQVMAQQAQIDLANQFMAEGDHDTAAEAYELFLKHYPNYPQREQIELILGLIYARYLNRPDRARELLRAAAERLDGSDRELARQTLADLGG